MQITNIQKHHFSSYLLWPQEVDIDIGIPGGWINAIMAEVFTHILRGGLRQ